MKLPQKKEIADALCRAIWERITGRKYRRLRFETRWEHVRAGLVVARGLAINALVDQGEEYFLKVGIGAQAAAATTYLGLSQSNESTLGEAVALAGINEVTGTGYARKALTSGLSDWTASQVGGDWQMQSKQLTFTAGGTWATALSMFLATSSDNSGKVLGTKDLGAARSLIINDVLNCVLTLKLS
jgi:hypothetical protein